MLAPLKLLSPHGVVSFLTENYALLRIYWKRWLLPQFSLRHAPVAQVLSSHFTLGCVAWQ